MSEAPATPPPAEPKRNFFEGAYDRIVAPVRRWMKADDEHQVGMRVKGNVRREKHTQVRLLFVDVGNASRSQMAQAYALIAGFHAESAGTFPSMRLTEETLHVMRQQGIDLSDFRPKPLDTRRLGAFDRVISFGNALPRHLAGDVPLDSWNTLDPQGLPLDAFLQARRDIERRIKELARRHGVKRPETVLLTP